MSDKEAPATHELLLMSRIDMLERQVEELLLNERRCEISMSFTDITTFEYDIATGVITTGPNDLDEFAMPLIHANGMEDIIASGIITERSIPDFRELYNKIDSGEPSASATIVALDAKNTERFLALDLVTIFDKNGKPLRAVGVRKDITETMLLKKEKQYGDSLSALHNLSFEANITTDRVISYSKTWAEPFGLGEIVSYSQTMEAILSENIVHPEQLALVRRTLDHNAIIEAFNSGKRLLSFEYLKNIAGRGYEWHEQTVNIIKDRLSGDIIIRAYIINIHERKRKELHALDEQRHFEMMRARSIVIYEVNITKNTFVSGYDKLPRGCAAGHGSNYTKIIKILRESTIFSEDQDIFEAFFARDRILNMHAEGRSELTCEYRTLNDSGNFIWVRCTMHTFENPQTNDLCAFAYIENIHNNKQRELDLLYKAQHDMLTGFYDKSTAKEKIDEYLASTDDSETIHAFFILDIDRFKSINDHFGHAFGDSVLARTAQKLRALFRKTDLLCRIGGDEFVILMKDVRSYKTALLKAQEMCDSILDKYAYNGGEYTLSISVGLAFFDRHGKTYDELYNRSDNALYYAKEHGRNRFAVYHSNIRGNITALQDQGRQLLFQSNNFSATISEHVFRTLYEANDKDSAINSALALVGEHYNVSRTYVFENSDDGRFTSNTYEWCNTGIDPQMDALQAIPFSELGAYCDNFNDEGVFYLPDISQTCGATHSILEAQNIKSMVQVSIVQDGKFAGFVGFDQCDMLHVPSLNELWDYRNVANILGVFIMEMRILAESKSMRDMALSIVNGLDSYAYVCDPQTHRLLFINEETMRLVPNTKVGDYCYRTFWGLDQPCPQCPMSELEKRRKKTCAMDIYNFNLNLWVKATASWIDWLDEKQVCLIESVDITKYKLEWSI